MQNFINVHAVMVKKMSTCYYKNKDTLTIPETTDQSIIFDFIVYVYIQSVKITSRNLNYSSN